MEKIKEEFVFNYNKQEIKVKLLGSVYCAIFDKVAKPIKIEFSKEGEIHKGRISTWEGKFLSWLPETAIEQIEPKDIIIRLKAFFESINI